MQFLKKHWLQLALTTAAAAYAYQLDARDGSIAWPLLLTGTIIAASGFFGGSHLVNRLRHEYDNR